MVISTVMMRHATQLAMARRRASVSNRPAHGLVEDTDACLLDLYGAVGECAAADYLELSWPISVNTFKTEPDLPPHFEVRTVTLAGRRLIVREDDADDRIYILVTLDVTTRPWTANLDGWTSGAEAKDPQWLIAPAGREPAYFVPTSALSRMDLWKPCQTNISMRY